MTLVEWSDEFKIGEREVDKEHWGLFALVNDLSDKRASGVSPASVTATLDALIDYVKVHFDHEETLMADIGYPDLAAHKKAHQGLEQRVKEFQSAFADNPETFDYDAFFDFLTNWLKHHILKVDMEFSDFHRNQLRQ